MIETTHEWASKLEAGSASLASVACRNLIPDKQLDADGFNLANCDAHSRMIVRGIEAVMNSSSAPNVTAKKLLSELLYRKTYGAFAEIAAYEYLSRCNMAFTPQVELTANDVLAESGSTVDGKLWTGLYFDVKAFGFTGRLIATLKEKLQKEFPHDEVAIADSWDVPLIALSDLLANPAIVVDDLQHKRLYRK
jgi:hypothetical protein